MHQLNPRAHTPLYEGALRLTDVRPGVQFVRYYSHFAHGQRLSATRTEEFVTGLFHGSQDTYWVITRGVETSPSFQADSVHYEYPQSLADMGVIMYDGDVLRKRWNPTNFAVKIEKHSIGKFYQWLKEEKKDIRSAEQLMAKWPEWCKSYDEEHRLEQQVKVAKDELNRLTRLLNLARLKRADA